MLTLFKKSGKKSHGAHLEKDVVTVGDKPLGSFELTSKEATMGDRIKNHPGGVFGYVTLEKPDGRTKQSLTDRLLAFKTKTSSNPVAVDDLPVVDLIRDTEVFSFTNMISPADFKKLENYIGIYEIMLVIRPTQGFFSNFGKITAEIIDNRFSDPTTVRKAVANGNTTFVVNFSLDYYVHKKDLNKIELQVAMPMSPFKNGTVWASMRSQISIKQSAEALQPSLVPTVGFNSLPVAAVSQMKHNPMSLRLDVNQDNIDDLKRMHARKELRDLSAVGRDQIVDDFGGSVAGDSVNMDNDSVEGLRVAALNKQRNESGFNDYIPGVIDRPVKNKQVSFGNKPSSINIVDTGSSLVAYLQSNFPYIKLDGSEKSFANIVNFSQYFEGMSAREKAVIVYVNFEEKMIQGVDFEGSDEISFENLVSKYSSFEFA